VDYDQIVVSNGNVTLGSATLSVLFLPSLSPSFGDTFTLINVLNPTNTVSGTFTNLPEGSTFTNNSFIYQLSYTGGDGNDVTLTVAGHDSTGVTRTWTGGGTNSQWANPTNWSGNIAPVQGDALTFPTTAARTTNVNGSFQADTTFDDLAGLPASLAATISGLSGRATALEQEVCGSRTDLERSYVEYLQLKRDVSGLDRNWVSPTAYGCNLKADFVTLLHRHMVSICLQVAIFRWEKRKTLEDAAKQARAKNLIDLVLECAHPKLHEPQGTSQGEGQKQPYQAPPSSVSQPQGA